LSIEIGLSPSDRRRAAPQKGDHCPVPPLPAVPPFPAELPCPREMRQMWQKAQTVPAKCANCGGAHTASYRGCPRFPRGYQGKKSPNQNHSGPQQKRAPATTAAPAPSAAPMTQSAPVKQPAAGPKSATKSFADATASKKPAAPAQTPAQKNSTAEKIITEVLMAIQTSTSTEQTLAKVLAIIPKVLT
jgi:hypothetical protein